MTKPKIAENSGAPIDLETTDREALTVGAVVLEIDFRSRRRERVYDADKVWSGEQTSRDYTRSPKRALRGLGPQRASLSSTITRPTHS
jgi:hypothetical protein